MIRLQAPQAAINRLHDVARRKAPIIRALGNRIEDFGRED